MKTTAYCNTEQHTVCIDDVTKADRTLNTYFVIESGVKKFLIPVLEGTKHFRHRSDIIRAEYYKGGSEMSRRHLECQLVMYARAKDKKLTIKIADQDCPIHHHWGCPKWNKDTCTAHRSGLLDWGNRYQTVIFEGILRIDRTTIRGDIRLNSGDDHEAAIEVVNKHDDESPKLALGIPTLVVYVPDDNDKMPYERDNVFDTTTENNYAMENGWALPEMLSQYPCPNILDTYRQRAMKEAQTKTKKRKKETANDTEDLTVHKSYRHGLAPQDKLQIGKYAGELLDYVWHIDSEYVKWLRKCHPRMIVLTPYARSRYNLSPTNIEELLDQCIDELDRVVDFGQHKGETIDNIATKNLTYVTEFLQKKADLFTPKLSDDCIEYLKSVYI